MLSLPRVGRLLLPLFVLLLVPLLTAGARRLTVNPAEKVVFHDLDGVSYSTADRSSLPTVFLFLSTECPIARKYSPRLARLATKYGAKGVRFFAVYPGPTESAAGIRLAARERRLSFPQVMDQGRLARFFGATITPEAVVLDREGRVRYQGRIDDNADSERVRHHSLALALEAVLAGQPVLLSRTRAFGCLIPDLAKPSTPPTTALTYSKDIAPLLSRHCLGCHRPGEIGPFPLDSYARAAAWAQAIKTEVSARRMPPWKEVSTGRFHNEARLSAGEIAMLTEWADGGTPEGTPKETEDSLPPASSPPAAWKLGKPDAVFEMPEEFTVAAEGRDTYQCFVIPARLAGDRWIQGVEYHPGNRAVVHHMSAFVDTTGQARRMASQDRSTPGYRNPTPGNGPGFTPIASQLGGWTPGHSPRRLPPGVAILLPEGGDIVIEVHYHPTGKQEKDRSRLGLFFSREPVRKRLRIGDVSNIVFKIPAGNPEYRVESGAFVPEAMTLLSLSPHMHNLGRSMKAEYTLPDGTRHPLIEVQQWDFRWQPSYRLRKPLKLPRGTRIDVVAIFDNSEQNPDNPHRPPRTITWGEGSDDEMCTLFLAYTLDGEDLQNEPVAVEALPTR